MLKRLALYLLPVLALIVIPANPAPGQNEKKNAYCVLVDNTSSLEKQFAHVQAISREVVKRIQGRGPISLFNFMKVPYIPRDTQGNPDVSMTEGRVWTRLTTGVEWSEDQNELGDYINGLSVVKARNQLFETIRAMADELNVNVDSDRDSYNDKIIILITDGGDQSEGLEIEFDGRFVKFPEAKTVRKKQIEQLIKELKLSEIKVYAIGLLGELSAYGAIGNEKTQKQEAEYFLKKITKETGGRSVVSMSGKVNIDKSLDELFAR